jgi:hypothetical protein
MKNFTTTAIRGILFPMAMAVRAMAVEIMASRECLLHSLRSNLLLVRTNVP